MTSPGLWREVESYSDHEWYCEECEAGQYNGGDARGAAIAHTQETQHTTRAFWTNRHVFTGAELPCTSTGSSSSSPTCQG